MKRREFIKGAATCAVGLATGLNLFAKRLTRPARQI
nr:twin-arginine translocation signal domain-containing protein [uncultured Campylobacter sp.]